MSSIQEDFFLKSINIDNIFKTFEKADYLFLYSIKHCMENSEIEDGVYTNILDGNTFKVSDGKISSNLCPVLVKVPR